MKLAIVGTGYVGLVCGAGLADMGFRVVCMDDDAAKIDTLKSGRCPIYEPGLEEMMSRGLAAGKLSFTTDLQEALDGTEVCFIAVGTPMGEDGRADLSYVLAAADQIGRQMQGPLCIVDKSTVPVGTADRVKAAVAARLAERGLDYPFAVVSNPEFLKEGAAVEDFMKPDRIIIGADDPAAVELLREVYKPFSRRHEKIIVMDPRSAEMSKYAANALLATKISFINEIAAICEKVGADVNQVRLGIGSDPRIGYDFIYPGCGFGGSCFPKDLAALIALAEANGCRALVAEAVAEVNRRQKGLLAEKAQARFGPDLSGRIFAVWGLAFKPQTDDMRQAPSIDLIRRLTEQGARVRAYDPQAMAAARDFYLKDLPGLEYAENPYQASEGAEALFVVTEWKEFRHPDWDRLKRRMKSPVIFDGRNLYDRSGLAAAGFEYYGIG